MTTGISSTEFRDAAERAFTDAARYLISSQPNLLLTQPKNPELRKIADIKRYNQLVTFVMDEWQLNVMPREDLPRKGYASWLLALGGGSHAIALDIGQMKRWANETEMPVAAQKIRSIMHEVGHYHLSRGVQPPANEREFFFSEATPEEEERAWCYAMSFFGALLGRYALLARGERSIDDTPNIIV